MTDNEDCAGAHEFLDWVQPQGNYKRGSLRERLFYAFKGLLEGQPLPNLEQVNFAFMKAGLAMEKLADGEDTETTEREEAQGT